MTLMKKLLEELDRNKELLREYEAIPTGFIGASMIKLDIQKAEKSIEENNLVDMLSVFEILKNNE